MQSHIEELYVKSQVQPEVEDLTHMFLQQESTKREFQFYTNDGLFRKSLTNTCLYACFWKWMLQQYKKIWNLGSKNISPSLDSSTIFEHICFCERLYDLENGAIKKIDKFALLYSNMFINSIG